MSSHYNIQRSQLPFQRYGHFAVAWNDAVIVWGGFSGGETFQERVSVVYLHVSGKWIKKETSGDTLKNKHSGTVQVFDNKMYVLVQGKCMAELCRDCNRYPVYCLDLFTWTWTRLQPSGTPPLKGSGGIRSWIHDGKIYCFGGNKIQDGDSRRYPSYLKIRAGASNQLFCYNVSENCWEWPIFRGDIPSPRSYFSLCKSDDTVFLFGGTLGTGEDTETFNDLFILDVKKCIWKKLHDNISNGLVPSTDIIYSDNLTCISQSRAFLHGTYRDGNNSFRRECWVLDLNKAKKLKQPSDIWTQVYLNFNSRRGCQHILEPVSRRLWLMGGYDQMHDYILQYSDVLKISCNPVPLKVLAAEFVAKSVRADDTRLDPEQLPEELIKMIEGHRIS